MSTLFPVGHVLKGRIGQYVISKQLQETVWLAKLVLPSRAPSALARGLDTYLMHSEGFVHSDIKPDNVMVNYGSNDTDNRFTDVQLADFGGSLPEDHQHAREGTPIGAAIWRSPESLFGMPWDVKTDIWSFGTLLISLIYGADFNLFDPPGVTFKFGDPDYEFQVLRRQFQFFAPPPGKYAELFTDEKMVEKMFAIMASLKQDLKPFRLITEREICAVDKEFIKWFMKLDPRDRPSVEEILAHEWWGNEEDVQR